MACEQCNLVGPFVCVSVFPNSGPSAGEQLDYGIQFQGFQEIGGQTHVTYRVCNCNPDAQASGISFASFQLCPDSPTIDVAATEAANIGVSAEIRQAGDDDFPFAAVKLEFSPSIEPGVCRDVVLVYNATGVTASDFGSGNVGVKIGGGPANVPTTANFNFGLPLLGCPNGDDGCPNDCDSVICGDNNIPFTCPITACEGFDLVPGSAQAAICSGDIECSVTFCEQEMDINVCGQEFTCCVDVPLRRLQGTLTIATSAEFVDPCGNQVAFCCETDIDVDTLCVFCPGETVDCDDLPALCELFSVSVGEPAQAEPNGDWIVSGVVVNDCACEEETETFTNGNPISIPESGNATPYPSEINVSGMSGSVSTVTVTLNDFSHTWPEDVDVMLVAPDGTTNTILMADPNLDTDVLNIDLTFDDAAAMNVPCGGTLTTGIYRPTNCSDIFGNDIFSSPAPIPSATVALSNFNGLDPNGTWRLFVRDDFGPDAGSIADGWSITITTTCPE